MTHVSVLLHEAIDSLHIVPGETFVDGTVGGGGHIEEVAKRFGRHIRIIGIDLDAQALSRAKARIAPLDADVTFVEGNFRNIGALLQSLGIQYVDKILLDIGLSSNQFEESGRGFSFQKDEPILMTFAESVTEETLTALDVINSWDKENIETILKGFGEERFAKPIAEAVVKRRQVKPIETTFELVEIVKSATPDWYQHQKIHPATKTFQALRVAVNDELEALKEGISEGFNALNLGGRLAVISFHSLEDRIVKRFFKEMENTGKGRVVTKKPITPSREEIEDNPRSRSAKLRILEKI